MELLSLEFSRVLVLIKVWSYIDIPESITLDVMEQKISEHTVDRGLWTRGNRCSVGWSQIVKTFKFQKFSLLHPESTYWYCRSRTKSKIFTYERPHGVRYEGTWPEDDNQSQLVTAYKDEFQHFWVSGWVSSLPYFRHDFQPTSEKA